MCSRHDRKIHKKTLDSAAKLTAQLCSQYNLGIDDLWTHQGIVGWKDCPRWYNTHPEDWIRLKKGRRFIKKPN